jgi:hypothetical protein
LTTTEREALWQDYIRFGELFGMPRSAAPSDYDAFRAYYRGRLASDEMHLTDEARYIGYATAFEIPLPRAHQPAKRVHDLLMLGSLPPRVRELYGLRFGRRHQLAFDGVVRAARRRIDHGRPTPQLPGGAPVGIAPRWEKSAGPPVPASPQAETLVLGVCNNCCSQLPRPNHRPRGAPERNIPFC